jgi:hypothetical protein
VAWPVNSPRRWSALIGIGAVGAGVGIYHHVSGEVSVASCVRGVCLTSFLYISVVEGYFRGICDKEFFMRGVRYEGRDAVVGGRLVVALGLGLAAFMILL